MTVFCLSTHRNGKPRRLDLGTPRVMAVLNVTPDSFSDGGRFPEARPAWEEALRMETSGAEVIDIGGESSGPGSLGVTLQEELDRVIPVVQELRARSEVWISVDTWRAEVARTALEAGADMVNDVTALRGDPHMGALLAQSSCPAVLMYSKDPSARTTRESPDYPDVVAQVRTFFQERLQLAAELGIRQENLMLDPGLGFFVSGNPSFSFELLRRLPELATLGCSLLVGTSRKSFLAGVLPGHHLAPSERRVPSLTAALWAWLHGAQVVRVHDVDETILMRATLQALQGKTPAF